MPIKIPKESRKRAELIRDSRIEFLKRSSRLQDEIEQIIRDILLSKSGLQTRDGNLVATAENFQKLRQLALASDGIMSGPMQEFLNWIVSVTEKIKNLNGSYFKKVSKENFTDKVQKKVLEIMDSKYGVYQGKTSLDGALSFLGMMSTETAIEKVRSMALAGITQGMGWQEFQRTLSDAIARRVGSGKLGVVEGYLYTNAFDIFQEYDRHIALLYAENLGMNYAIYSGRLRKTSRDWCEEFAGKTLHKDEIAKWTDYEWQGKSYPPYNPFTNCGGFNCVHTWDWITDEMAELTTSVKTSEIANRVLGGGFNTLKDIGDRLSELLPNTNIDWGSMNLEAAKGVLRGIEAVNGVNGVRALRTLDNIVALTNAEILKDGRFTFKHTQANGWYNRETRTIYLNIDNIQKPPGYFKMIRVSYEDDWSLENKVNALKEEIQSIRTAKETLLKTYKRTKSEDVLAGYNRLQSEFDELNSKFLFYRSLEWAGIDEIPYSISSKTENAGQKAMYVTIHEMGHHVDMFHRDMSSTEDFAWRVPFVKGKNAISEYSQANQAEYFAEWWAHWVTSNFDNDGIPDPLVRLFERAVTEDTRLKNLTLDKVKGLIQDLIGEDTSIVLGNLDPETAMGIVDAIKNMGGVDQISHYKTLKQILVLDDAQIRKLTGKAKNNFNGAYGFRSKHIILSESVFTDQERINAIRATRHPGWNIKTQIADVEASIEINQKHLEDAEQTMDRSMILMLRKEIRYLTAQLDLLQDMESWGYDMRAFSMSSMATTLRDKIRRTFTHEFGHHIDFMMTRAHETDVKGFEEKYGVPWQYKYFKSGTNFGISDYSHSSRLEWFAEWWTHFIEKEKAYGMVPDDLAKLFRIGLEYDPDASTADELADLMENTIRALTEDQEMPKLTVREIEIMIKAVIGREDIEVDLTGLSVDSAMGILDAIEEVNKDGNLKVWENVTGIYARTEDQIRSMGDHKGVTGLGYYENVKRYIVLNIDKVDDQERAKTVYNEQLTQNDINRLIDETGKKLAYRKGEAEPEDGDLTYFRKSVEQWEDKLAMLKKLQEAGLKFRPYSTMALAKNTRERAYLTMIHEFGHVVDWNTRDLLAMREAREKFIKWTFEVGNLDDPSGRYNPTEYSAVNLNEFFAEWFALWVITGRKEIGEKGSIIPAEILPIFKYIYSQI